jgi:hypothetical protein
MRYRILAVVAVSSLALGLVAAWGAAQRADGRVEDSPEVQASYTAAVCDAIAKGLPTPPPLRFTSGKWMIVACDEAGF